MSTNEIATAIAILSVRISAGRFPALLTSATTPLDDFEDYSVRLVWRQ
jgi:hypothetical protein